MKKTFFLLFVFVALNGFSALPISRTQFRKAPAETVTQYAEDGNAEAQLELALRYYAGHQVPADPQKSFQWMSRAAEQKHPKALYALCLMHIEGIGTPATDSAAFEQSLANALTIIPDDEKIRAMYEEHLKKLQPSQEATERFLKTCSDTGYNPAYVGLNSKKAIELYQSKKYKEALPLLRSLSESGDSQATFCLAQIYNKGLGGVTTDEMKAMALYLNAANKGHTEAQFKLAMALNSAQANTGHTDESTFWLNKAVQSGHLDAQFYLAKQTFAEAMVIAKKLKWTRSNKESYAQLERDYDKKISEAIKWYKTAAKAGHAGAQFTMGRLATSGDFISKDYKKAIQYFQLAADQGHADALFYLGLMNQAGLSMQKDLNKAIALYEQAATQGSLGAGYYLGNCYRLGIGVPQSLAIGENYYLKKVLPNTSTPIQDAQEISPTPWMTKAAREYGVILWNKGEQEQALEWIAWAAKYEAPNARKILRQMLMKDRAPLSETHAIIHEETSNPSQDANASVSEIATGCRYLLEDAKELYGTNPLGIISWVSPPQEHKGSGQSLDTFEMSALYIPPNPEELAGNNGVLLMGVALESSNGEKYLAFDVIKDSTVLLGEDSEIKISMSIATPQERLKVSDWFVLYGHVSNESTVLTVLDLQPNMNDIEKFEQLFLKSQPLPRLKTTITKTAAGLEETIEQIIEDSAEDSSWYGTIIDYIDVFNLLD